jgi:hypothetical protein
MSNESLQLPSARSKEVIGFPPIELLSRAGG